jgi:hypothetical protein
MKLQKIAKIYRDAARPGSPPFERLAHNRRGRGPRPGDAMTAARFWYGRPSPHPRVVGYALTRLECSFQQIER